MTDSDASYYQPSQFLIDNINLLPKVRALDVAMGGGRNAVYLSTMGFDVEGVDISPEAVDNALALAGKNRVEVKAMVADLEEHYQIEKEAYDLIVCFNYLQRSLIPRIKEGLRPGGMVVYETYTVDQPQFGRPKNPDYLLKYNELLEMFREFRCLRYREGIIENRKAIAGIVAEKV
ncbi:MAG: methyltransferase domain-containing protein [Deltaproteobacteria bacterium]|nr:methyltransferase domain-containing protein [Deltaproteobacteria bacterium]